MPRSCCQRTRRWSFKTALILWNSVEQIEKSKDSQLAREVEVALPVELSREQQLSLVRSYVKDNFVDAQAKEKKRNEPER